eukprot:gene28777-35697_t
MTSVLFQSPLTFSNSDSPVDITLVEHFSQGCIELVAYNQRSEREAIKLGLPYDSSHFGVEDESLGVSGVCLSVSLDDDDSPAIGKLQSAYSIFSPHFKRSDTMLTTATSSSTISGGSKLKRAHVERHLTLADYDSTKSTQVERSDSVRSDLSEDDRDRSQSFASLMSENSESTLQVYPTAETTPRLDSRTASPPDATLRGKASASRRSLLRGSSLGNSLEAAISSVTQGIATLAPMPVVDASPARVPSRRPSIEKSKSLGASSPLPPLGAVLARPRASRSRRGSLQSSVDEAYLSGLSSNCISSDFEDEEDARPVRRSRDVLLSDNLSRSPSPTIDSVARKMSKVGGHMTTSGVGMPLDLSTILTAVGSYNSSFSGGSGSGEITARQTMGKTPPCSPMVSSNYLEPLVKSPVLPSASSSPHGMSSEDLFSYMSSALTRGNTLKSIASPPSSTSVSIQSSAQTTPRIGMTSPRSLPALSMSRCASPRGPPLSPGLTLNAFVPEGIASPRGPPLSPGGLTLNVFAPEGIASPQYVSPNRVAPMFNFNNLVDEGNLEMEDATQDSVEGVGYMHFDDSTKFSVMSEGDDDLADDESLFYMMNDLHSVSQDQSHQQQQSNVQLKVQTPPLVATEVSPSKFHSARGLPPRVSSTTPPPNMYAN